MTDILLALLNMSLMGGAVILAVLVLRFLLRRAPKRVTCLLWAVVFFRLLCPFSPESPLSILPTAKPIQASPTAQQAPEVHTGIPVINTAVNSLLTGPQAAAPVNAAPAPSASTSTTPSTTPAISQPEDKTVSPIQVVCGVWLAGFGTLAVLTLASYLRLRRAVAQAVPLGGGVYSCHQIGSPFLLGTVRPRIYIPEGLQGPELDYVLAHERAHVARRDYLWKPLAWLAVLLHWFNPLVWLSFRLLVRDMELACDERATQSYDLEQRQGYSLTLLKLAAPWHFAAACPVAFGEGSVKQRVKRVLNDRKPALWLVAAAVVVVVLAAVCLGSNPQNRDQEKSSYQDFLEQVETQSLSVYNVIFSNRLVELEDDLQEQVRQVLLSGQDPGRLQPGNVMADSLFLSVGDEYLFFYPVDGQEEMLLLSRISDEGVPKTNSILLERDKSVQPVLIGQDESVTLFSMPTCEPLALYSQEDIAQIQQILQEQESRQRQKDTEQMIEQFFTELDELRLSVALAAVTLEQLDQAVESFNFLDRQHITLLAENEPLGLRLYGYGDESRYGEGLLLRYQDQIYPIHAYWSDSLFSSPQLYAADYDGDGQTEVAFAVLQGHGTGCMSYDLFVVEFLPDDTLEIHPFVNYDLVTQNVTSTWDVDSHVLRLYDDGQLFFEDVVEYRIGDELGNEYIYPIQGVCGGMILCFEITENSIVLQTDFYIEGSPGIYFSRDGFRSIITWDGTQFTRDNYAMWADRQPSASP